MGEQKLEKNYESWAMRRRRLIGDSLHRPRQWRRSRATGGRWRRPPERKTAARNVISPQLGYNYLGVCCGEMRRHMWRCMRYRRRRQAGRENGDAGGGANSYRRLARAHYNDIITLVWPQIASPLIGGVITASALCLSTIVADGILHWRKRQC